MNEDFDFTNTGQIGDTIGGLMNPFIALSGVIVTGLAFYIQYRANKQQRELFVEEQAANTKQLQDQINHQNSEIKVQQFESQFYEMLSLHRDNATEMRINGYDFKEIRNKEEVYLDRFEKVTEGRKVFVTMKTELECLFGIWLNLFPKLGKEGFKKCYLLFFSGLDEFKKKFPEDAEFIAKVTKARERHEEPDIDNIKFNSVRKEYLPKAQLYFNYKPFSGHASRLGHYFRHLFLTVKSVVKSKEIKSYKERMRYLKLLRAQLSNHEQILLFYNWLGDYGEAWENDSNRFFTEYCMIHNLWHDTLFDDELIESAVNELRTKKTDLRKKNMFEID
ncbi:hypothetical protein GCM10023313_08000 [Mucilaginibacter defluvii]|uniref:Phage abortive infection protein n=1 Tax=Mucilaginibacter defluvii TaxID=1196019 RepID=A0ABP9FLB2_9SPHI